MTPLNIFIGYDPKESVAYHVLSHSILRRASRPVSITPLALTQLGKVYHRPKDPKASTEFSYSRFLVPYLSGYEGVSIYMDCDMLCLRDIWTLVDYHGPMFAGDLLALGPGSEKINKETSDYIDRERKKSVWVCQHPDYTPKTGYKMDGQKQSAYPRKNWSSLMVFNNAKCRDLTPDVVNEFSGAVLHRFAWLSDDDIGSLPLSWNWLVGEYDPNPKADILHYTLGGPWFPTPGSHDHLQEWLEEVADMNGFLKGSMVV